MESETENRITLIKVLPRKFCLTCSIRNLPQHPDCFHFLVGAVYIGDTPDYEYVFSPWPTDEHLKEFIEWWEAGYPSSLEGDSGWWQTKGYTIERLTRHHR